MSTNNTATDTFSLEIPKADISLLKSLVKRMGWTVHKATVKPNAYEQALDNKEHGRINEYANADELFNQLGI
uniref:Type II toxin-antitoxin system antitoxin, RelB/DinJ family n=1 Tax=Prevotella sp. GTC17262 TaxID=3236797 RepID=A0AB33JQI0_9BACT